MMRVEMKNSLQKSAGSLKMKMPTSTVPTAPMPVHTAYAVPMGSVSVTLYNKYMLMERQIKNPAIHKMEVVPDVSLALPRQVAKPISNKPAMMSKNQFMEE